MSDLVKSVGYFQQSKAARAAGKAQRAAARFEAAQHEQNAIQNVAVAQREAMDENRKARLLASRALALAAAGGGGAADPSVARVVADIEGEGAYRASVAMYQGEEAARKNRLAARARRYEGDMAKAEGKALSRSYKTQGIASLAESAENSLFAKYG